VFFHSGQNGFGGYKEWHSQEREKQTLSSRNLSG
jgi:hypothetical protein